MCGAGTRKTLTLRLCSCGLYSFIAMVLACFVAFGRLEWHKVDDLQVHSLSSRAKRICWRKRLAFQQLDEMSRGESITL